MTILYIPFYLEVNPARKRELDECLAANVMNKAIDKIVLIADETISGSTTYPFDKIAIHHLGRRPTFGDIFYQVIPKYSDDEATNIISNSDIYFDTTLDKLKYVDWDRDIVLALSRHNKTEWGWKQMEGTDSQDVWIFKGPIKGMFSNFSLGNWGADNRIAYEIEKAGYWVFDLGSEIICKHVHNDSFRKPRKDTDFTVQPPYKLLPKSNFYHIKTKPVIKIGHIGMGAFITEKVLCDALRKLGDYDFIDWLKYTEAPKNFIIKDRDKFEEMVLNMSKWADVIFMQVQGEGVITKELAYKMKQVNPRVKLVNWTGDARTELPQYLIDAAPYCITMITNDSDVKKLRAMGFDAEYLQVGFSPDYYNPKGYVDKKEPVVFMGQNYGAGDLKLPNGTLREEMVTFLKDTYKEKFGVYGRGWKWKETEDLNTDIIKEASVYRGAQIGINISHLDLELYTSDRLLRMMACGVMVLCKHYPRMDEEYVDGKHLVTWQTLTELKDKIDYYLEHEEERAAIAKAGCELVHSTGTWDKQFKKMLELVNKYPNKPVAAPKVYHSQQAEEQWILDYFKDFKGTVLDLGANDGMTLSNSYDALKQGWTGTLVEPSVTAFTKLKYLWGNFKDIQVFNAAISDREGIVTFYESGTHLGKGDTSLVSTIVLDEKKKWAKETFTEIPVTTITVDGLLEAAKIKKYDLISIDCEGMDLIILKQMNLTEMGCKMLIIEYNGVAEVKKEIIDYCKGYRLLHDTNINLCLAL